VNSFVYDTGALLAIERSDQRFGQFHRRRVVDRRGRAFVPVVVLAQAWRGGPQPLLSRLLQDCEVVPDSEAVGRRAGVACARAGMSDVVDAIVVMTALVTDSTVVTSDPVDLERLASALGRKLPMLVV
jgi:predicted nucleic acid-binding protein